MYYNDFLRALTNAEKSITDWYGDFAIGYKPIIDDGMVVDIEIHWAPVNNCSLDSVYRFAEALSAASFEAARLVGTEIVD